MGEGFWVVSVVIQFCRSDSRVDRVCWDFVRLGTGLLDNVIDIGEILREDYF